MKLSSLCAALVLLLAFAATGRADEFSDIQNNPHTLSVPAPNVYGGAPDPYSYYAARRRSFFTDNLRPHRRAFSSTSVFIIRVSAGTLHFPNAFK